LSRLCAFCGGVISSRRSSRARTCSHRCNQRLQVARRTARLHGFPVPPLLIRRIREFLPGVGEPNALCPQCRRDLLTFQTRDGWLISWCVTCQTQTVVPRRKAAA